MPVSSFDNTLRQLAIDLTAAGRLLMHFYGSQQKDPVQLKRAIRVAEAMEFWTRRHAISAIAFTNRSQELQATHPNPDECELALWHLVVGRLGAAVATYSIALDWPSDGRPDAAGTQGLRGPRNALAKCMEQALMACRTAWPEEMATRLILEACEQAASLVAHAMQDLLEELAESSSEERAALSRGIQQSVDRSLKASAISALGLELQL